MSVETLSRFILLPELKLIRAFNIGNWAIGFLVEKTTPFEVCPKCANPSKSIYDHRRVKIKDEPLRNKAAFLFINKRRFACKSCRKPFMEPVPGISKGRRTTQRLRAGVCWASETYADLTKVQRNYRCSADTVYRATYEQLELRRRSRVYPFPSDIGIDEHSLKKPKYQATVFASIIVDHKNKKVFELINGRSKPELEAGIKDIPGRENVRRVTIDLSPTFKSFVRHNFPNAVIIADRFHVQRLFTKKVNRYRKKVTGDKRKNPIRKLLLRNAADLEWYERRAVREWLNFYPELREIYDYKEAMRRIYLIKGKDRAEKRLRNLCDRMGRSKNIDVLNLRKTILSWRKEIVAYHEHQGMSNGRVEGFNRKAKLCQRAAYGYKKFKNYRLRLLNLCS